MSVNNSFRRFHFVDNSCDPSHQLDDGAIMASDHVRLLGVTIASDVSLGKHANNVCKT